MTALITFGSNAFENNFGLVPFAKRSASKIQRGGRSIKTSLTVREFSKCLTDAWKWFLYRSCGASSLLWVVFCMSDSRWSKRSESIFGDAVVNKLLRRAVGISNRAATAGYRDRVKSKGDVSVDLWVCWL